MLKKVFFILICFSAAMELACSSAETPNANSNSAANRIDSTNIPPEFSNTPVNVNGTIPGINDQKNANQMPTGNIPGIPNANTAKTPQPKNTPKIEGIPDQETIKRQMNTPLKDVNIVNNPPANQRSTANDQPASKRGNTRQP